MAFSIALWLGSRSETNVTTKSQSVTYIARSCLLPSVLAMRAIPRERKSAEAMTLAVFKWSHISPTRNPNKERLTDGGLKIANTKGSLSRKCENDDD